MKIRAKMLTGINGDGLYFPYISIYFYGCDKFPRCVNCQNPEMQNWEGQIPSLDEFDLNEVIEVLESQVDFFFNQLDYETISLCFVGGEPLYEKNKDAMFIIAKHFKKKYGNRICTVMYSWRTLQQIKENFDINQFKYIDIGVLGEFDQSKFEPNTIPASTNQCIYNFTSNTNLNKININQKNIPSDLVISNGI